MKKKFKKIYKAIMLSALGVGAISTIIASSIINYSSNYSNLFAEIVTSDSSSIIADSSFNEGAFDGYKNFLISKGIDELGSTSEIKPVNSYREGFGLWRRPGNNNIERETTFKGIFRNGKDIIIAPGFNQQNSIMNVLNDPAYNNKGFIYLDGTIDKSIVEYSRNISTVIFRMEQAGFQTGFAASEFLSINSHIFAADDGKLKIGSFVGLALPSTMDFLVGFQKGMVAWNKINNGNIQWVTLGDNANNYSSGSFGVGGGVEKSKELLSKGADIIMPIAGPQSIDLVNEISLGDRPVAVVGVDSPQENQTINNKVIPGLGNKKIKLADGISDSKNQNIIQFSAEKKLDVAVKNILDAITNKEYPNNEDPSNPSGIISTKSFGGFGYENVIALGPKGDSAVGITEAGRDYFIKGFQASTFEEALKLLENNIYFKEMITIGNADPVLIKFYNTPTGLPTSSNRWVKDTNVFQYNNGLKNSISSFAPTIDGKIVRLNGTLWKISK